MRDLFAQDTQRFDRFSLIFEDILLDYSKNLITEETIHHLHQLAQQEQVEQGIAGMFAGDKINQTEQLPALHIALRNRSQRPILVAGLDVIPLVNTELQKMRTFSLARLFRTPYHRCGEHLGVAGGLIRAQQWQQRLCALMLSRLSICTLFPTWMKTISPILWNTSSRKRPYLF